MTVPSFLTIAHLTLYDARRRKIQEAHNKKHKITPKSVQRAILDMTGNPEGADYVDLTATPRMAAMKKQAQKQIADIAVEDIPKTVADLRKKMHAAAEDLDFEKAADLRDRIKTLEAIELAMR